MLSVMVVDDEPLARERLRRMLAQEPDCQLVGEAGNGMQALALARQQLPDIILLDVRMPGMDGLQAARELTCLPNPPAIIFCTAYNEYALNAFDVDAVGYVLKPVRQAALREALARAQRISRAQLSALAGQAQPSAAWLTVTTAAGVERLAVQEISHFRADNKYVVAYCRGRERVVDASLRALEQRFGESLLRIHRNCLVSVAHIDALQRTPAGRSVLRLRGVAEPLPVSRRHVAQVKAVLQQA